MSDDVIIKNQEDLKRFFKLSFILGHHCGNFEVDLKDLYYFNVVKKWYNKETKSNNKF